MKMRQLWRSLVITGTLAMFCGAAAAADTGFVPGLADIPLMPGLEPLGDTLLFDTPAGRIAEAVFTGSVGGAAVSSFYGTTLPQLGWRAEGTTGHFVRDREQLKLHIGGSKPATVRLVIEPVR